MKKILVLTLILIIIFSFVSCSDTNGLKSQKIITTCVMQYVDGDILYTFISDATGVNEEGKKSETKSESYKVKEKNFSDSAKSFEKEYGKLDMSHVNTFILEENYVRNALKKDIVHINEKIKPSPLIKVFVASSDGESIVNSIKSIFDGGSGEYIEAVYKNNRKNILCTLSEIVFSFENPFFTASLPVLYADENGAVKVSDMIFINSEKGIIKTEKDDFMMYEDYLLKYGKTSEGLKFEIQDNSLLVMANKNTQDLKNIFKLAQKYRDKDFDILNSLYFSKKNFMTFKSWENFIQNTTVKNIIYQGEDV